MSLFADNMIYLENPKTLQVIMKQVGIQKSGGKKSAQIIVEMFILTAFTSPEISVSLKLYEISQL